LTAFTVTNWIAACAGMSVLDWPGDVRNKKTLERRLSALPLHGQHQVFLRDEALAD
jgi:hypothetical protein